MALRQVLLNGRSQSPARGECGPRRTGAVHRFLELLQRGKVVVDIDADSEGHSGQRFSTRKGGTNRNSFPSLGVRERRLYLFGKASS
jgi:hypothetical protein